MPPKKRVSAAMQVLRDRGEEESVLPPGKRQKLDRRSALTEKQSNRTNSSGSSRKLRSTDDGMESSTPKKPVKPKAIRTAVKTEEVENMDVVMGLAGEQVMCTVSSLTSTHDLAVEEKPPKTEIECEPTPKPKQKFSFGELVYEHIENKADLGHWKDFSKKSADEIADLVHKKSTWTPQLLSLFQFSDVTAISLSAYVDPYLPHDFTPLLSAFFKPHSFPNSFPNLTKLSLAQLPISPDHIDLLRLLPNLTDLDLSSTGISTQALHHLAVHRHSLTTLNLNHNPAISDDSRVPLIALISLKYVYLRGTNITMPGLRRFVNDLPSASTLRLVMIPEHCINYLNDRHRKYQTEITSPMIADPVAVGNLSAPLLKRNIEYHARVNKDIVTTGTKVDMVMRLQNILSNRLADGKIVRALGKG